jgi:hypothetical protein
VSLAYTFDDPGAEGRLRTQYFEIMGTLTATAARNLAAALVDAADEFDRLTQSLGTGRR